MSKKILKLASRGKRFGAYCIDSVIPFVLTVIIISCVGKLIAYTGMNYGYGYGFGMYGYGMGTGISGLVVMTVISVIIAVIYTAIQIVFYTRSKTIGKAILGLQVVSSKDGQPVGTWRMILREWIVKRASEAVFCLGYIWVLIDDKNRGWHDKIMDTYVVDLNESAKLYQASEPAVTPEPVAAPEPAAAPEPVPTPEPSAVPEPVEAPDQDESFEQDAVSETDVIAETINNSPVIDLNKEQDVEKSFEPVDDEPESVNNIYMNPTE